MLADKLQNLLTAMMECGIIADYAIVDDYVVVKPTEGSRFIKFEW